MPRSDYPTRVAGNEWRSPEATVQTVTDISEDLLRDLASTRPEQGRVLSL